MARDPRDNQRNRVFPSKLSALYVDTISNKGEIRGKRRMKQGRACSKRGSKNAGN